MTASQNILTLIHEVAIFFPVFLLLFSFRGFFLAGVAKLLGDSSASEEGFLTMNPFVHIKIHHLALVVFIIYGINNFLGISKMPGDLALFLLICSRDAWLTKNPISHDAFKYSRLYNILYSFASPASFLIMAFSGFALMKILNLNILPDYAFLSTVECLKSIIFTATLAGALHCIPIPPLDAGRIWYSLTPTTYHHIINRLSQYSLFVFTLVVYARPSLWIVISDLQTTFESTFISILF